MENKKSTKNEDEILAYGAGFGLTFGIILGSIFDGIGIAFGISIGIILGVAITFVFRDKIVQLLGNEEKADSKNKKN